MTVRVRFAPSPTGYLHIGGLRTALYNYLFARQQGGAFILRIEDTDRNRLVEGSVENLIKSLEWAGLTFDEGPGREGDCGPYQQSERLDLYQTYAKQLIDAGQAYYAFDTPEELQAMREEQQARKVPSVYYDRQKMKNSLTAIPDQVKEWMDTGVPHVVRLKVPDDQETFTFEDVVRGEVSFQREHVDDQVLIKTDGFPTYHLASVVDDHSMGITHIIRGEEWLSSVPKHLVMYKYFGWEVPKMVHLPLLLNADGSKLSKRQNDVAVEDYMGKGYLPEALVNYIALLGWNPGDNQEHFTMEQLIEHFSLERINKSGAVFDVDKLNWFNKHHMREQPVEALVGKATEVLRDAGRDEAQLSADFVQKLIEVLDERLTVINDIAEQSTYFFDDPESYDEKLAAKRWKAQSSELALAYADKLEGVEPFTLESAEAALKEVAEEKGVKSGALMFPTRLALSGQGKGPGLFDIMFLIGREACIRRLRAAASRLLPEA